MIICLGMVNSKFDESPTPNHLVLSFFRSVHRFDSLRLSLLKVKAIFNYKGNLKRGYGSPGYRPYITCDRNHLPRL